MLRKFRNASLVMVMVTVIAFVMQFVLWYGGMIPTDVTISMDVLTMISLIVFGLCASISQMIIESEEWEEEEEA